MEELAKERLKQGMLNYLYLFDAQGTKDPNYESIFKNSDIKLFARIKGNLIREEEIDFIWTFYKQKIVFILFFVLYYQVEQQKYYGISLVQPSL